MESIGFIALVKIAGQHVVSLADLFTPKDLSGPQVEKSTHWLGRCVLKEININVKNAGRDKMKSNYIAII